MCNFPFEIRLVIASTRRGWQWMLQLGKTLTIHKIDLNNSSFQYSAIQNNKRRRRRRRERKELLEMA